MFPEAHRFAKFTWNYRLFYKAIYKLIYVCPIITYVMQMLRNNYLIVDTCDLISNICRCLYHFKSKCYKTGWFNSIWEVRVSLVCQHYIT